MCISPLALLDGVSATFTKKQALPQKPLISKNSDLETVDAYKAFPTINVKNGSKKIRLIFAI